MTRTRQLEILDFAEREPLIPNQPQQKGNFINIMTGSHSHADPPIFFFPLLIAYGIILIIGGWRKWPFLLQSGRLQRWLRRFFVFSTEETNDFAAGIYILCGIVAIITGVVGLIILY